MPLDPLESSLPKSGEAESAAEEDVSLAPGPNADPREDVEKYVTAAIRDRFEVHSYRHAAALLGTSFQGEFAEITSALSAFEISTQEIALPGGNESLIPKKLSAFLRPRDWVETRVQGDLSIRLKRTVKKSSGKARPESVANAVKFENFIDGHKIDYVKGRVAFDLEWNSKDQTFDRDLYAFRTFHECGVISVAVLLTRGQRLNRVFEVLPLLTKQGGIDRGSDGKAKLCMQKYGASTTWMGKLLYRLNAGRHGACPVLVLGITPKVISDWETHELNPKNRTPTEQ